jgi:hypothetical protein
MATPAALFTGLVKAQMAPAIRQLRIEAAMKFFSRTPDVTRMALLRRVAAGSVYLTLLGLGRSRLPFLINVLNRLRSDQMSFGYPLFDLAPD